MVFVLAKILIFYELVNFIGVFFDKFIILPIFRQKISFYGCIENELSLKSCNFVL